MERLAPVTPVTVWQVLVSNDFAEGVADVRLGRAPAGLETPFPARNEPRQFLSFLGGAF
jgi:hypothetical protein